MSNTHNCNHDCENCENKCEEVEQGCNHDCDNCSHQCGGCSSKEDFIKPQNQYSDVKNVIAIMSGKGGVGKSMVTSLLASKLNKEVYQVGILDADITGPSIPKCFGIHERLEASSECIFPREAKDGVKVVSSNLLLENELIEWAQNLIASSDLLHQSNPESYKFIARALFANGYFELAIVFCKRSLKLFYCDPEAFLILSQCHYLLGDLGEALDCINRVNDIIDDYFPAIIFDKILRDEIKKKNESK